MNGSYAEMTHDYEGVCVFVFFGKLVYISIVLCYWYNLCIYVCTAAVNAYGRLSKPVSVLLYLYVYSYIFVHV